MEKALNSFVGWIDARLPVTRAWNTHMGEYYAPKNFNLWYFFGVFSLLVLVNQLLTGIWLTMNYTPSAEEAFSSVEYIMRDVDYGWLLRYMHSTGASAFFIVVYLHMFRALIYGSYKKPRELLWVFGMMIFIVLMAEAFVGYVLPWGQMSYWGAQVIISLFGAIPVVGEDIVTWIRGDYLLSGITLNRFFALHVVALPIVLLALVVLHILALHEVGSNNPDGVEIKKKKDANGIPLDGIRFHPYYSVHDIQGIAVFLFFFCAILFFAPEMGGFFLEFANFEQANGLKTPEHIAPVWYFTPYYSMLRAITGEMMYVLIVCVLLGAFLAVKNNPMPSILKAGVVGGAVVISALMYGIDAKFWGVVVMGGAVIIMFFLPWLDHSPVKSIRYRPDWHKYVYAVFVIDFLILGYLGVQPPSPIGERVSQVGTMFYFGFFLLMPWWSKLGEPKPVPDRVIFVAH